MTGAVVKHDVIMLMFVPQWGGGIIVDVASGWKHGCV